MGKVIDSLTGVEFDSYQDYLNHTSPVTGKKPTDPEHHGKRGLLVAKKALERTGSLGDKEEKEIDDQLKVVETQKIQEKLAENKAKQIKEVLAERPTKKEEWRSITKDKLKAVVEEKEVIEKSPTRKK